MISVVVPFYDNRPEKKTMLKRAVDSFKGHDELIVVWNQAMGFSKAVNKGYELARGDYIIMASDDCYVNEGNLSMLAVPGVVTSPSVNAEVQDFSGVMWCFPRDIYEKYGMLDENFTAGILWEDEDLHLRLHAENIKHYCVSSVVICHPEGGATLNHTPEHEKRSNINKQYLINKWGLDE